MCPSWCLHRTRPDLWSNTSQHKKSSDRLSTINYTAKIYSRCRSQTQFSFCSKMFSWQDFQTQTVYCFFSLLYSVWTVNITNYVKIWFSYICSLPSFLLYQCISNTCFSSNIAFKCWIFSSELFFFPFVSSKSSLDVFILLQGSQMWRRTHQDRHSLKHISCFNCSAERLLLKGKIHVFLKQTYGKRDNAILYTEW